jgi:GTP-binding protein
MLTCYCRLRRIFLLVDASHSLKTSDIDLLRLLSRSSLPHQIVLTKLDKLLLPTSKTSPQTLLTHLSTKLPPLFASIRATLEKEVYRDSKGKIIRMGTRVSGDILGVSSEIGVPKGEKGRKMGVDVLRWECLAAAGLESDMEGRPRSMEVNVAGDIGAWN